MSCIELVEERYMQIIPIQKLYKYQQKAKETTKAVRRQLIKENILGIF